jgi:hypothetical protein
LVRLLSKVFQMQTGQKTEKIGNQTVHYDTAPNKK